MDPVVNSPSPRGWRGPKPVVGLMGGIGSGKSTVARQLAALGCAVIDADDLARQALNDPAVKAELAQQWGGAVLQADGSVNRREIARLVFADADKLALLESLTHPRVHEQRQALRARFNADPSVRAIVEDCPLLLEKGIDRQCDVLVFVRASAEARAGRVAARGWSAEELARRERNQWPLDNKAQRADYVVENNAGEAECLDQVRRVLNTILRRTV